MKSACQLTAIVLALLCHPCLGQENLLGPTKDVSTWRFEAQHGGEGRMTLGVDAAVFTTTATTGTDWHVQAVMPNIELTEGAEYTLSFELKAMDSQLVKVNAMIDEEDWHQVGLHQELFPPDKFKEYEFKFTATDVAEGKKNRITFVLGESKGSVAVRNVKLVKHNER